jgi:hypothetical protein
MDVLEGDVTGEMCLNDGADVCKVGFEVVHVVDGSIGGAGGNGCLDLVQVFPGFAEEFLGLAVI